MLNLTWVFFSVPEKKRALKNCILSRLRLFVSTMMNQEKSSSKTTDDRPLKSPMAPPTIHKSLKLTPAGAGHHLLQLLVLTQNCKACQHRIFLCKYNLNDVKPCVDMEKYQVCWHFHLAVFGCCCVPLERFLDRFFLFDQVFYRTLTFLVLTICRTFCSFISKYPVDLS